MANHVSAKKRIRRNARMEIVNKGIKLDKRNGKKTLISLLSQS